MTTSRERQDKYAVECFMRWLYDHGVNHPNATYAPEWRKPVFLDGGLRVAYMVDGLQTTSKANKYDYPGNWRAAFDDAWLQYREYVQRELSTIAECTPKANK